jgi:hypothetical protein
MILSAGHFLDDSNQVPSHPVRDALIKYALAVGFMFSGVESKATEDWQYIRSDTNCKELSSLPKIKSAPKESTPRVLSEIIAKVKTGISHIPPSSQTHHVYPVIIQSSENPSDIREIEIYRENVDIKDKKTGKSLPRWPWKYISTNVCSAHTYIKPNWLNSPLVFLDKTGTPWNILAWNAHYDKKEPKRQSYAPVTELMKDPWLVEEWQKRLSSYLDRTDLWLRDNEVKITYANKSVLLANVATKELIYTLIVIEKMDPTQYKGEDRGAWYGIMDEQILKIYGRLWANKSDAWISQKNEFWACGIAQYIPRSWEAAELRFPMMWLWKHSESCTNHELSLRAMYGHIDMELEEFFKKPLLYAWLTGEGSRYYSLILAMGYNMKATRLAEKFESALSNWKRNPEEIMSEVITKLPRRNPKVEAETLTYAFKFLYFAKKQWISEPWMEKLSDEILERILYERANPVETLKKGFVWPPEKAKKKKK